MSMIRTFTMLAALLAAPASVAFADTPAKPPEKKIDRPADKPADKPAAGDKAVKKEALSEADAKRFVAFFDKLVAIVVANQDDCAKMAAAVNAHIDANAALLKEAAEAKGHNKELPQSARDAIAKKSKDELAPAITKKCGNDKPVMDAFMRMKTQSSK